MNFRLTKWKVIISVVVIIVWYFLILYYVSIQESPLCTMCLPIFNPDNCPACPNVFHVEIIPDPYYPSPCSCFCDCPFPTPISKIAKDLFIILIPGILIYVIWSLFQKKK